MSSDDLEHTSTAARADARARLLSHIDLHDSPQGEAQGGPGGYSEEAFAELGRLVEALKPLTPIAAPMDAQECVEGRWETLFAHFGARHSAFKAKVHESNLKIQSFNLLPPIPVRIERICQEISRTGVAYNNVIDDVVVGHPGTGDFLADPLDAHRYWRQQIEALNLEVGLVHFGLEGRVPSAKVRKESFPAPLNALLSVHGCGNRRERFERLDQSTEFGEGLFAVAAGAALSLALWRIVQIDVTQ